MRSISEITRRKKLIEIVRWFCVLPAAVLGDFVASFVVRAVVRIASYGGLGILGNSAFAYWFGLFLSYAPQKAAFVVPGHAGCVQPQNVNLPVRVGRPDQSAFRVVGGPFADVPPGQCRRDLAA